MAMRERSDEDLVEEAKAGNDAAFAALYVRHRRAVHARCFGILRDHDEAADAAQNAMLSALRALRRDGSPTNLRGWLLSIAHNEAVSLLRRGRPVEPLDAHDGGAGPGADEGAFQRERLRQLVDDLNALPDRQRCALLLREASGFSYRDIASELGTSTGNARQTVHAARRNLRKRRVGREHGWLGFALPGFAAAWVEEVTANLTSAGKAALVAGALVAGGGAASQVGDGGNGLLGAAAPRALVDPPPARALAALPHRLVWAALARTKAASAAPTRTEPGPAPAPAAERSAEPPPSRSSRFRPSPVMQAQEQPRRWTHAPGSESGGTGRDLAADHSQGRPTPVAEMARRPDCDRSAQPSSAEVAPPTATPRSTSGRQSPAPPSGPAAQPSSPQ